MVFFVEGFHVELHPLAEQLVHVPRACDHEDRADHDYAHDPPEVGLDGVEVIHDGDAGGDEEQPEVGYEQV